MCVRVFSTRICRQAASAGKSLPNRRIICAMFSAWLVESRESYSRYCASLMKSASENFHNFPNSIQMSWVPRKLARSYLKCVVENDENILAVCPERDDIWQPRKFSRSFSMSSSVHVYSNGGNPSPFIFNCHQTGFDADSTPLTRYMSTAQREQTEKDPRVCHSACSTAYTSTMMLLVTRFGMTVQLRTTPHTVRFLLLA